MTFIVIATCIIQHTITISFVILPFTLSTEMKSEERFNLETLLCKPEKKVSTFCVCDVNNSVLYLTNTHIISRGGRGEDFHKQYN